jgi:hypothetical protein
MPFLPHKSALPWRPVLPAKSDAHKARIISLFIAIAGWRFVRTKDIDREDEVASPGERFDLMLASMIGFLGAALFLYLAHAVFPAI